MNVQEILTELTADHMAALIEIYCQPHRCDLRVNGKDMATEMERLGVYKGGTGPGQHPMRDKGYAVVNELIKQGKWPK